MILYEFEGKQLLEKAGVKIPKSHLVSSLNDKVNLNPPLVLKAQVLSGKRADTGGIIKIQSSKYKVQSLKDLFGKIINKEKVAKVLVEELIEYQEPEYYLSFSYDTDTRGPVLTLSQNGGTGVEEASSKSFHVDPLTRSVQNKDIDLPQQLLVSLINLFFDQDCLLVEINPLVKTDKGWVALDAKIKLDDSASGRHEEWSFPPRSAPGHILSEREIEANKIDQGDWRGVAGSTYFDLDGDIAVLASGGGGSLVALDALLKSGGKPANYTEYSGNPPKEKVTKLTRIVLSKPGIHGLWVVGAVANFTDIYETLLGFVDGLRQAETELGVKFDFPIVIRRGGPRDKEAFEMLKQVKEFDLTLLGEETSIVASAKIMADLAKNYAITT